MNIDFLNRLPQRQPFLFVDSIIEETQNSIKTSWQPKACAEFFKGHFPDFPVVPGVLLQEALFQSAAILMNKPSSESNEIGVIAKVEKAKFKGIVRPNDLIEMNVTEIERMPNAAYFKGESIVNGKKVLLIEFSCALVSREYLK